MPDQNIDQNFEELKIRQSIRNLISDEPQSFGDAIDYLYSLDIDTFIEVLLIVIQDKDEQVEVRSEAIKELGLLQDPQVTGTLLSILSSESIELGKAIVTALGRIQDKRATPKLIQLLQTPSLVFEASWALGLIGDKRAVEPIFNIFKSYPPKSFERFKMAEDLVRLGDNRVLEDLIYYLQDQSSDDSRRYTAASLLGELGDKRAISPLLSALNDPSDSVRGNSASSLGTLGAVEAVEPLLEFLVTHEPDEMKLSSQMGAVSALGMLGDKSVINALQDFLKREGNLPFRGPRAVLIIRIMAALYQLGEEQYFNKLVDLLDSSEGMIRVETLATLDRLNNPQVLTIARNLINDFDENISYIAIQILGNRGNLEDLPLLQTILLQKRFVTHRSHRFAARKAIMNIENRLAT